MHLVCTLLKYLVQTTQKVRKIRAPIKIKSALPPPPPAKPKILPPPPLKKKRGILWTWVFLAERTHFVQASIKLAQPFPAPELRTRILRTRGFSEKEQARSKGDKRDPFRTCTLFFDSSAPLLHPSRCSGLHTSPEINPARNQQRRFGNGPNTVSESTVSLQQPHARVARACACGLKNSSMRSRVQHENPAISDNMTYNAIQ